MENHVNGQATPFPQAEILVKHPLTGAMWNITPLLALIHEVGHDNPSMAAEAIYNVGDYMTAEQNSPRDTAARLREVLRLTNAVGTALDSVSIYTAQPR
jgi:hypothetical protein